MQPSVSRNLMNDTSPPAVDQAQVWRYFLILGTIALAYFLTARFSLSILNLGIKASPIWPPAGIAMAAVLGYGRWAALGVALGVFWANAWVGAPVLLSAGSILGSTLQPIVGRVLLRRFKFHAALGHLRDVLGFVSLAVLVTPITNATIGTVNAYALGHLGWDQVAQNWWTIWLGDGMGILILTPSLLAVRQWFGCKDFAGWRSRFKRTGLAQGGSFHTPHCLAYCLKPAIDSPSALEKWLWLSSLIASSWIVFYSLPGETIAMYPLEYLPFPFIIWAALRFGQVRAVLASLILSVIAISGTLLERGPFIAKAETVSQVILLLQAFIGVITITALILAAVTATRQEAEIQLRLTAERNRLLAEMATRIRQSLDLHEILQRTVEEVRYFLQADRVFFGCVDGQGQVEVVAESVASGWTSMLGWVTDPHAYEELQTVLGENICVVDQVSQEELTPFIAEYYNRFQVKADIAVPIVLSSEHCTSFKGQATGGASSTVRSSHLFGILVVNQCATPREWQPLEIGLLEQLGTQVAIAIQQGQLYQQVQNLNANLEKQVEERTLQLQANMTELEELNQLRDVFIHAIAHDLRTTVMGSLMVLKNLQSQSGEQITLPRNLLNRMVQSGEIQLCKLNSLLEAYKNKTEGTVIRTERLSFPALLKQVVQDLDPLIEQNRVNLVHQVEEELPSIMADSAQVERVLRHLLVNAVKHNPPGVRVTIRVTAQQDRLYCEVEDNGQGISPNQCDRLFDLRIGSVQERQLTGISLGLYLCHQIVTAHGGEIGVRSAIDEGSCFWFTLPLVAKANAQRPIIIA